MADTLTRRQLAALTGSLAASGVAATSVGSVKAQEAATAPQGLLEQRKANRIRAAEELSAFELGYADEPLFRLVLK